MFSGDIWRAVSPGNRADRNLATKSTNGGRAIRRTATRVKLEQAPKAALRMPIRRESGEGSTDPVHRGSEHSTPERESASVGEARGGGEWPIPNGAGKGGCRKSARPV